MEHSIKVALYAGFGEVVVMFVFKREVSAVWSLPPLLDDAFGVGESILRAFGLLEYWA